MDIYLVIPVSFFSENIYSIIINAIPTTVLIEVICQNCLKYIICYKTMKENTPKIRYTGISYI